MFNQLSLTLHGGSLLVAFLFLRLARLSPFRALTFSPGRREAKKIKVEAKMRLAAVTAIISAIFAPRRPQNVDSRNAVWPVLCRRRFVFPDP